MMLYCSELGPGKLKRSLARLNSAFEQSGTPDRSTNYVLDETTRLRVVPLAGDISSAYAVFVESMSIRAKIDSL